MYFLHNSKPQQDFNKIPNLSAAQKEPTKGGVNRNGFLFQGVLYSNSYNTVLEIV